MRGALLIIFILLVILAPASSQVRVSGADFIQNATLTPFAIHTEDVPVDSVFTFNVNGATNMSLQTAKIPTAAQPRSSIFAANAVSTTSRSLQKAGVPTSASQRSSIFLLHESSGDQKDLAYPQALLNDIAAPVISDITAETFAEGEVQVNWTTNEFTTGLVRLGVTEGDYGQGLSDDLYQMNHSRVFQGLTEGTKYFFVVSSVDRNGNEADSGPMDLVA